MNRRDVEQRFDRAADTFDAADFIHAAAREGLVARLEPMTIEAKTILDLGSATGSSGRLLRKKFRRSMVLSIDLSRRMLAKASQRASWFSKPAAVQADACRLPLAGGSIDLAFANLLLPWVDDRAAVFAEIARVLRRDGLFMFSTLGPDSPAGIVPEPFADMHDVGDDLVRSGLRDPVLDVDRLTVTWKDGESLRRDLAATGAGELPPGGFDAPELEFELVYGHSWGPGPRAPAGEIRVDVGRIAKRSP